MVARPNKINCSPSPWLIDRNWYNGNSTSLSWVWGQGEGLSFVPQIKHLVSNLKETLYCQNLFLWTNLQKILYLLLFLCVRPKIPAMSSHFTLKVKQRVEHMASLHCGAAPRPLLFLPVSPLLPRKMRNLENRVASWFPLSVIHIPLTWRLLPQVLSLCHVCQLVFSNKCHCLLLCFELEHVSVSLHVQLKAALRWFNSPFLVWPYSQWGMCIQTSSYCTIATGHKFKRFGTASGWESIPIGSFCPAHAFLLIEMPGIC